VLGANTLLLLGGCDGGETNNEEVNEDEFIERDLSDLAILNLDTMAYLAPTLREGPLAPRSGHTAHLVPVEEPPPEGGRDGGGACMLALMVLGGRDYRPPLDPWSEGQHLGRGDVQMLMLAR
jgi:hypothetical protein